MKNIKVRGKAAKIYRALGATEDYIRVLTSKTGKHTNYCKSPYMGSVETAKRWGIIIDDELEETHHD